MMQYKHLTSCRRAFYSIIFPKRLLNVQVFAVTMTRTLNFYPFLIVKGKKTNDIC